MEVYFPLWTSEHACLSLLSLSFAFLLRILSHHMCAVTLLPSDECELSVCAFKPACNVHARSITSSENKAHNPFVFLLNESRELDLSLNL